MLSALTHLALSRPGERQVRVMGSAQGQGEDGKRGQNHDRHRNSPYRVGRIARGSVESEMGSHERNDNEPFRHWIYAPGEAIPAGGLEGTDAVARLPGPVACQRNKRRASRGLRWHDRGPTKEIRT